LLRTAGDLGLPIVNVADFGAGGDARFRGKLGEGVILLVTVSGSISPIDRPAFLRDAVVEHPDREQPGLHFESRGDPVEGLELGGGKLLSVAWRSMNPGATI
jgi:hypothetical protein